LKINRYIEYFGRYLFAEISVMGGKNGINGIKKFLFDQKWIEILQF